MEEKDFEVFDTNEPINVDIDEIKNDIDLNDVENELGNINISYVNDNNEIIEPKEIEVTPQITINDAGEITSAAFIESNGEDENKKAMPQFIFNESGVVTDVKYNTEPVVEKTETIESAAPKYTFDENGIVTSRNAPKNVDEKVSPEFLFDENGALTSITLGEESTINLNQEAIDEIKENSAMIKEALDKYNYIDNMAHEIGLAENEYFKNTFEKTAIFEIVKEKFIESEEEYLESLNNNSENDKDLTHLQF